MKFRTALIATTLAAAGLISGAAHAALQGRDLDGNLATFEAYYDTVLDITWLADANYGAGSAYDDEGLFSPDGTTTDGRMTWASANAWAANLSFTDGVNVYDNWRLPSTLQPDASCGHQIPAGSYGYNCAGSEMGYLFYIELSGTAGQSILISTDLDLAKFTNIQPGEYWSATEYAPNPTHYAWDFFMQAGDQAASYKVYDLYAWAVSSGDVASIPEAQTYVLMLAGLGLIGWRARRCG